MKSPYRNILQPDDGEKRRNQIRWDKTLLFLRPAVGRTHRGLDIGDRSTITPELEKYFGFKFDNTSIDLDYAWIPNKYNVITCFEVLEHLFNPLNCLTEINHALLPGASLYISTPKHKPYFLWGDHFHEMHEKQILALFNRAGFEIIRRETIFTVPLRSLLTGIRPWIRLFYDRVWLFELRRR